MKSEKMKMKAIRIHQYGGPEVLAQVEMQRPTPGHDEVLIKVHAASVNPIDWKLRAGHVKEVFPLSFPSTLGWDVSGTVEGAGDTVTQFKRGDEVYALVKGGGYAEYVVAKATVVAKKPRTLDHVHAAAVPVAGLTALQALFEVAQLVYRLAYNGDVAAGQLAVFQGASEVPISGSIRAERATRKNSQLAAARRVALKMGRRPRCSPVTYRSRYAPSSRLAGGPF